MANNNIQSAATEIVNRLNTFFEAMRRWESACKASYRRVKRGEVEYEVARSEWIESLRTLFQEYCTSWDEPARARHGIQFSMIPTYGADLESVLSVEIDGALAKVVTQHRSVPGDRLVYRLTHNGREWRIDDNRKRVEDDGAEVDWDL